VRRAATRRRQWSRAITGELADLAETAAKDAQKMLVNAWRALRRAQVKAQKLAGAGGADPAAGRRRGRLHRAVNDLAGLPADTRKIAVQTRQRGSRDHPARGDPAGQPNRVGRLCGQQRIYSAFAKKKGLRGRQGPAVHDDRVKRKFTAQAANTLWLKDITEHRTDEGKLYLCAINDVRSNAGSSATRSTRI